MFRLNVLLTLCLLTSTVYAEVFDISAIITAGQETTAPTGVAPGAGGFASLEYDDVTKELSWNVAWQQLTGPATGMHFHAPAAAGTNAGVAVNIGNVSGLVSPSVGSTTVTDEFAANLLAGISYINIHTSANGPGEIRGQVNPTNVRLSATLDSDQEVPSPTGVSASAAGNAQIAYDPSTGLLGWNIAWDDLSGPATGMHFHGPAAPGSTAGVLVNIGNISGLTSPSIGSTTITGEQASQLLGGEWYINIHTAANGPGEIRGQVVPEPHALASVILGLLVVGTVRRRRR